MVEIDHAMELKEACGVLAVGGSGLDVGGEEEVAAGSQSDGDQGEYEEQRDGEDNDAFLHSA